MTLLRPSLMTSAALITLATFGTIATFAGCERPQPPATAAGTTLAGGGPLAEVLILVETGDTEDAIEHFVNEPPTNWIESTTLEEFQLSDAEFQQLERSEQTRLQTQIINRVGDLKGFARMVVDNASKLKKDGKTETAEKYLESVNRLGKQLRDADVVLVFQQTGNALATATLAD